MSDLVKISEKYSNLIEKICKERELVTYKIEISSGSAKGDGYASKLYRIAINGTTKDAGKKTLHVILKTAPAGDNFRKSFRIEWLFNRELYMYQTVLPEFNKFQDELNVPEQDRFRSCCKIYGGSGDCLEEVIAMKNLKESGYELWDRKTDMDFEVVKMIVQVLGRFHALSFALREKKPELFDELAENTADILVPLMNEHQQSPMVTKNMEEALLALDPIKDREALNRFKKILGGGWELFENLMKKAIASKFAVISHGDCWCSNLMFKFEVSDKHFVRNHDATAYPKEWYN